MPEMTYRDAIRETLREALLENPDVYIMGEDIGMYGGSYAITKGFIQEFGKDRIIDSPIAESVVVGCGIGSAMMGMKPVIELMTINFSLLAMDQIVNNAAKLRYMSGGQISVPMIIRTVSGGGNMLGASHSQSLEGWYATVPGLRVVCPTTPYDARGLMRMAFKDENPVIFVEHSLLYETKGEVPLEKYDVPFGKADVKRQGKDVTVVGYSRQVQTSLRAADELAEAGIDVEVVDLRSLKPLDIKTVLASVRKTHRAVVVEETWKTGGFGAQIVADIVEQAFDDLDSPVLRVAGKDVSMAYSKALEQASIPQIQDIVKAVKSLF